MNKTDEKLEAPLNALTHKSIADLLLLGAVAMLGFAWTDHFLVPEKSRRAWLIVRFSAAAILLCMRFAMGRTAAKRYTKAYAYVGAMLCTATMLALNINLARFPSDHYASIILINAGLCLVTWSAWHTLSIGLLTCASWLCVNFLPLSQFDTEAFTFHAGYLGTGLFIAVAVSHVRQRLTLVTLLQKRDLADAVAQRETLARRTAHDIRSPVCAMQMVCDDRGLSEANRLLLRDAISRVNDIANNLVTWHGGNTEDADKSACANHVSPILHSLISEKRALFRAAGTAFVLEEGRDAASAFAQINKAAFARAVSNLLNNGAEAMTHKGTVTTRVRATCDKIVIAIQDEGCGIAPEHVVKVLRGGISVGKVQGSGLGLASSAAAMRQWGGELTLRSEQGKGTLIELTLPRTPPAEWFANAIEIPVAADVFVLDDDPSMKRLWGERLGDRVNAVHTFSSAAEFIGAVRECRRAHVCLVDVELAGADLSGTDAVERLGCWARTVFVTSLYDDKKLQALCIRSGARIVPKAFAAAVPLLHEGKRENAVA